MSINTIAISMASSLLPQVSNEVKENALEDFKLSAKIGLHAAKLATVIIPCSIAPLLAVSAVGSRFGLLGAMVAVPLMPDCIDCIATSYCDSKKQAQESNNKLYNSRALDLGVGAGVTAGLFYRTGKLISIIGDHAKDLKVSDPKFYAYSLTISCLKYSVDAARFSFATSFGASAYQAMKEKSSKDVAHPETSHDYSDLFYRSLSSSSNEGNLQIRQNLTKTLLEREGSVE